MQHRGVPTSPFELRGSVVVVGASSVGGGVAVTVSPSIGVVSTTVVTGPGAGAPSAQHFAGIRQRATGAL